MLLCLHRLVSTEERAVFVHGKRACGEKRYGYVTVFTSAPKEDECSVPCLGCLLPRKIIPRACLIVNV